MLNNTNFCATFSLQFKRKALKDLMFIQSQLITYVFIYAHCRRGMYICTVSDWKEHSYRVFYAH